MCCGHVTQTILWSSLEWNCIRECTHVLLYINFNEVVEIDHLIMEHFGKSFSNFFFHFEWFKMSQEHLLKLYKSSCDSKRNRIMFRIFQMFDNKLHEIFDWKYFFVETTCPNFGGCSIFTFNPFLSILSVTNAPKKELHLLLDTINNGPSSKNNKQIVT
jgi:hypothetical protein